MINSKLPVFTSLVREASVSALLAASMFVIPATQASPTGTAIPLHFRHVRSTVSVVGYFSNHGVSSREYSFRARAGQRLGIDLKDLVPHSHNVDDSIVTMYHITFPFGSQFGMKGYDPFNGKLTETGVYYLTVEVNQMASNGTHGRYRLTLHRS